MAANKAKRPIPPAQPLRHSPNPEPVELLPVKAHVYRVIAELNGSFEKLIHDLQALGKISFLRTDRLIAMHDLICRVRAEANRDFAMALHDREKTNSGYFEHLCGEWEGRADR
jgi:hypothetical protein